MNIALLIGVLRSSVLMLNKKKSREGVLEEVGEKTGSLVKLSQSSQ